MSAFGFETSRPLIARWTTLIASALVSTVLLVGIGCDGPSSDQDFIGFDGQAMGTQYGIVYRPVNEFDEEAIVQAEIDALLEQLDEELSNWRTDSWVSKFNEAPASVEIEIPEHALQVLSKSLDIARLSNGALDPTVSPLVELWGFGASEPPPAVPSDALVERTMEHCGYENLTVDPNAQTVRKERAGLQLNLSAVAKGYAVDSIAKILDQHEIVDYLVEFGGELKAVGVSPKGRPWRVGISKPIANLDRPRTIDQVLLENRALATSGNYQNFLKRDEEVYSHIIDPRTGFPVDNQVLSVSVVAPDCALADGLATACVVLGVDGARSLIDSLTNVETLVVVRSNEGPIRIVATDGWPGMVPPDE
ncbi:MAG: FAD:protein FMN transferase [Verrucomicrobiota bacterium]